MMYQYRCHVCGGMCDAGELESGVCYGCRDEELRKEEARILKMRKDVNQLIRARYAEQNDGQMVMMYG